MFHLDSDRRSVPSAGPTVLFVGRFVEGKRPIVAVEAVESVHEEFPEMDLLLAGDGPLRSAISERDAGTRFKNRTRLFGTLPYDEIPALYRAADLLVLPSESERFSRTVLEALACGTPAVTSHLPQHRDVVTTAGVTVPAGDVIALANTIE